MTYREQLLARLDSDEVAVIGPDERWTGRELYHRACGVAHWLDTLGVEPGHIVPAVVASSPAAMALAVAGVLGGRPVAPLNPRFTPAETAAIVESLGTSAVVTEERLQAPFADDYDWSPPDGVPCAVLHTSGTTGAPKRVPMPDPAMVARCRLYAETIDFSEGDSWVTAPPFHHISGLGMCFVALGLGGAAVTLPWFTLEGWRWVEEVGASHVMLVPTMIEMLLEAGGLDAGLRVLTYGGAPIHPATLEALLRRLPTTRVVQLFGQTEGSPLTVLGHEDHLAAMQDDRHLLGSIGRPAPRTELRLDDGEIVARAAHLFRPDDDGWLRTRDLADQDERGYLYLRGRTSDMIIRGGENVYPLEVERVLETHPGVREAAVVGKPDRRLGEVVAAVVVPVEASSPPDADELRAFVRGRLSGFKVPTEWSFADELPRNAMGKIVRREL